MWKQSRILLILFFLIFQSAQAQKSAAPNVASSAPVVAPTASSVATTAPTASQPNAEAPTAAAPNPIPTTTNLLQGIIEDYEYKSANRRDPFMAFVAPKIASSLPTAPVGPVLPLQKFDLDQLKVVGMMWDVRNPKAMIMDPNGKSYLVSVKDKVGRNNGYIAQIHEGEIEVREDAGDGKPGTTTRVMKMYQQKDFSN